MAAKKNTDVVLPADNSIQGALKKLQTGANGDFLMVTYEADGSTLKIDCQENGGLEAILNKLPGNEQRYVVLRKDHQIDKTQAVKFIFIDWTPNDVPPARRAILATHKQTVAKWLAPIHISLQASDKSDISEDLINSRISDAAGTASHVKNTVQSAPKQQWVPRSQGGGASPAKPKVPAAQPSKVAVENEEALKAAVKKLKDSTSDLQYIICGYEKGKVTLTKEGTDPEPGHIEAFLNAIPQGSISCGLVRVKDVIDKSVTWKFVFVWSVPNEVNPMQRAKAGTDKGAVTALFEPFHCEFMMSAPGEVTADSIVAKVQAASGTKVNVVEKKH